MPVDAGGSSVIGGTSAVAPMWAAIAAYLSQAAGRSLGQLATLIYGLPAGCMRDIVTGNNGLYVAKSGYDCCTGLGVPVVARLLAALAPAPTPTPAPPAPTPPAPPAPVPTSGSRTIVVSGTAVTVTVDGKTV